MTLAPETLVRPTPPSGQRPGVLLLLLVALMAASSLPGGECLAAGAGFLGVRIRATQQGARILEVIHDGGAEAAGLDEGDVILAVDGVSLAGLSISDMVGLLRGEPGSRARLLVLPFPGPGGELELSVSRRQPPQIQEQKGRKILDPALREANVLVGSFKAGRTPAVAAALSTWRQAAPDDPYPDIALLNTLRQADSLGWSTSAALSPEQRDSFWESLGGDSQVMDFLDGRDASVRLSAASYLARHSGSAPLALHLLEPLQDSSGDSRALLALAGAVLAREPAEAAACSLSLPDAWTPFSDWELAFGPRPSDMAALELAIRQDPTWEGLSRLLPADALTRLRSAGVPLPEPGKLEPQGVWGRAAAPVAPAFRIKSLDGSWLDLGANRSPLIISFWATWCGPCRQELPRLQETWKQLASTGLRIWAISTDDPGDLGKVESLVAELGLEIPVALAPPELLRAFGVGSVPRTFVLDAGNHIVEDHTGFTASTYGDLADSIRDVALGAAGASRSLGTLLWAEQEPRLLGSGFLEGKPDALLVDADNTPWLSLDDGLYPLRLEGGRITTDENRAVPLPFATSLLMWLDLDADGAQELVMAAEGGGVVRACRADGSTIWTTRGTDPVAALSSRRDKAGSAQVVVLRNGRELVSPPPGLKLKLEEGEKVVVDRPRLEILDRRGSLVFRVPLELPVLDLAFDASRGTLAVLLADASVFQVYPDGGQEELGTGLNRVRGLQYISLPGAEQSELVLTGNSARSVWSVGSDGGFIMLSGGGDLLGFDAGGRPLFRLDLQRRPLAVVADIDGDAVTELVVWAQWFGLAALTL